MENKERKKNKKLSFIIKILVILTLMAVIILNYDYLKNLDIRELINNSPSITATYFILEAVYLAKGITMVIPASIIYIAIGMALNTKTAIIINCIGIIIEITATYLLGLFLGGDTVVDKIKSVKKGEKILDLYEKYKKPGIFIIRFFGLPIDFCSLFFGAMKVPFAEYLIFSFIGIIPRVILFTILGDKVYNLIPMKYIVPAALIAAGIAVIVFTVRYIVKNSGQQTEEK